VVDWIRLLEHNPSLLYDSVALFGLVVGSFLNVVIHRLPKMLDDAWCRGCLGFLGQEQEMVPGPPHLTLAHPPPIAATAAPDTAIGEHPAPELSGPTRTLCRLRWSDRPGVTPWWRP